MQTVQVSGTFEVVHHSNLSSTMCAPQKRQRLPVLVRLELPFYSRPSFDLGISQPNLYHVGIKNCRQMKELELTLAVAAKKLSTSLKNLYEKDSR